MMEQQQRAQRRQQRRALPLAAVAALLVMVRARAGFPFGMSNPDNRSLCAGMHASLFRLLCLSLTRPAHGCDPSTTGTSHCLPVASRAAGSGEPPAASADGGDDDDDGGHG